MVGKGASCPANTHSELISLRGAFAEMTDWGILPSKVKERLGEHVIRRSSLRALAIIVVLVIGSVSGYALVNNPRLRALCGGPSIVVSEFLPLRTPVKQGDEVRIPLTITNVSSTAVRLRDRSTRCGRARFEHLPDRLEPAQSAQVTFIATTVGANGAMPCEAVASVHHKGFQEELRLSTELVVHADQVVRGMELGPIRAGRRAVRFEVNLQNLPAAALARVENVSPPGWSVHQTRASDRTTVFEIAGDAPSIPEGRPEERFFVDFDVFFRSPELRLAQVRLGAVLVSEWSIPKTIVIDTQSVSEHSVAFTVVHRSKDAQGADS